MCEKVCTFVDSDSDSERERGSEKVYTFVDSDSDSERERGREGVKRYAPLSMCIDIQIYPVGANTARQCSGR